MAPRVLRIFVSSPSDVAAERARVKLVTDRLNGELDGLVRLDLLRWEDAFYTAAHSFQEAIDTAIGNMSATDMVLCIVWKRAGLRLNPAIWHRADGSAYESGTVLEVETAVAVSREHDGVPDVYLFRKTAPVLYQADRAAEQMEQHQLLETVWKRWTESAEGYNTAGYQTFADEDDFEVKLEACLRQWLERRGVVARGPVWDRLLKGSPFRGLAAFDAAHAPVFFGRDAAIARAIGKLRRAPFLLIIGASGSGKSSLARAGIVPRVTEPGIVAEVDEWRTALVLPGADPLLALAEALFADGAIGAELRTGDFGTARLLARLFEAGTEAALAPIRSALARVAEGRRAALRYDAARPVRLLLTVDQMERLFVEAEASRVETFSRLLLALAESGLASAIAILRSDAYGKFQSVEPLLAALERHGSTLDVLPPSHGELEDIVTRPVAACHPPLAYETNSEGRSLAEQLVADAKGGDALPLLQMTLQRLFDAEAARGDGVLRFSDYPGMDAAVTRTADEAVAKLEPRALAALPALLLAFVRDVTVRPDGGIEALTIVPVARSAFERGDPDRIALIDQFVAQRLLTTEEIGGAVHIRPVHEALLRVVPAAVAVIAENAALIRIRRTLEPMVAEWQSADAARKPDFLVSSPALIAGAAQLVERFGDDLPVDMREFIAQSLDADRRRREVERNRQRRVLAATAAGLVIALVLAGLAGWQWQVANRERERALAALTAATNTADTLVFDLAREFRNRPNMPIELTRSILERVQELQRQLVRSGTTADLRRLEAVALNELAETYLVQGDRSAALSAAERSLAIMDELIRHFPNLRQLQRDRAISLNMLGDALRANDHWDDALAAYRRALAVLEPLARAEPDNLRLQRDLWIGLGKVAEVQAVRGSREEALAGFRRGLAMIEGFARRNPDDQQLQADLAFNHGRIAIVLASAGQLEGALAAHRQALAIREKLAAAIPNDTERQRDLLVSLTRIGELLDAMGQRPDALATFRAALAIVERLVASDRGNLQWQHDLAQARFQIANQLLLAGEREQALAGFRDSLAVQEKLVAAHPDNAPWRRYLEIILNKIGDTLFQLGRGEEATATYRRALAIAEAMLAQRADDVEAKRDLAYTLTRLGDSIATEKRGEARDVFRRALQMRLEIAVREPGNTHYQRDLTQLYDRLGQSHAADKEFNTALDYFGKARVIREALVRAAPANREWQRDLAVSHDRIGDTLYNAERKADALAAYRAANALIEKYAAADRDNVVWQTDLAINLYKLAHLGDDARARLTRALEIVRKLDAAGKLAPHQKTWPALIEQEIAKLPPA